MSSKNSQKSHISYQYKKNISKIESIERGRKMKRKLRPSGLKEK